MLRINKESDLYSDVANILAGVIGFGAATLINSFAKTVINNSDAGICKKASMRLGTIGLETISMYSISSTMREEIDNLSDMYNKLVDVVEKYKDCD